MNDAETNLHRLTEGESGLEILVDLAERGDIDPWDIDLEKVTEKYLRAISEQETNNLREAGKAIFYASILLRMKSDILSNKANEALSIGFDNAISDDMLLAEELGEGLDETRQITFKDLEKILRRRYLQKIKRHRVLTLEDLISALKDAQREEEEKQIKRNQQRLFDNFLDEFTIVEPELSDDIMELTHAEDLEASIERTRAFLSEHLLDRQGIDFRQLVRHLGSWSNAFLSIVFLAHEHEVKLEQEKLYGDLQIYEPES
jgi:segregation and condensation protein A